LRANDSEVDLQEAPDTRALQGFCSNYSQSLMQSQSAIKYRNDIDPMQSVIN